MKKLTTEEVIKQFREVHGDKYLYLGEYKGDRVPMKMYCLEHGQFYMTPSSHKRSLTGCKRCSFDNYGKRQMLSYKKYIEKCQIVHNNYYVYPEHQNIKNNKSIIAIICPIHGEFKQSIGAHTSGQGCISCARDTISEKLSYGYMQHIEECKIIHNNYYSYPKYQEIQNVNSEIIIICPIHGEFKQILTLHKRGSGCNICYNERSSKSIEDYIKLGIKNEFVWKGPYPKYSTDKTCWQCKEGHIFEREYDRILNRSNNCPICKESKIEKKTRMVLEELAIKHFTQKKFNKCKNKRPLPFDFYLPDYNILIECQGKQHYKPIDYFGGTESFIKRKENDYIKREYCKLNGIKLVDIPYWEIDNIMEIIVREVVP